MKLTTTLIIATALTLIVWQRVTINRLNHSITESENSFSLTEKNSKPKHIKSTPFDPPPSLDAKASEHLEHLQKINQISRPHPRTKETYTWSSTLTTKDSLSRALAALIDSDLPLDERNSLMGRFGPALFFQWGKIDPLRGIAVWNDLDDHTQLCLLGETSVINKHTQLTEGHTPPPLIQSWAAHHPDELFKSLDKTKLPAHSFFEAYVALARSNPNDMMNFLDQRTDKTLQKDLSSYVVSNSDKASLKITREYLQPQIINTISQSLIQQYGSIEEVLSYLKTLPESRSRTQVESDLLSLK